jgi:ubiquitin thioesterase protein OTUB1
MSLSDLHRNHFDPLHHFHPREESVTEFYSHPLSSPVFINHGISQLSSALYVPAYNMNAMSTEEMERYQELSNKFEPELPGPLVSHKQSTEAIAVEYANADPAFATKTNALAVTHPQSRIMKGDGNCGWRAVAFGYFENLFNFRNPLQAQQELVRIKNLNTILDQVGQEEHLYEIFVDATEEVFGQIIGAIERGERDDSFLVALFNDEYNSNAIITHFRVSNPAVIPALEHEIDSLHC